MADSRARDTEGRFATKPGSLPEVRLDDDKRLTKEERGGTLA